MGDKEEKPSLLSRILTRSKTKPGQLENQDILTEDESFRNDTLQNNTLLESTPKPKKSKKSKNEKKREKERKTLESQQVQGIEIADVGHLETFVGAFFDKMGNDNGDEKELTTGQVNNYILRAGDITKNINDFDGDKEKYKLFISECERAIQRCGDNAILKQNVLDNIISRLSKIGCKFTYTIKLTSWKEVKEICDHQFYVEKTEGDLFHDITSLKQNDLRVFDYYGKFADMIKEYGDIVAKEYTANDPLIKFSMDKINQLATIAFEKGLKAKIREGLANQKFTKLKDIYEKAKKYETMLDEIEAREKSSLSDELKELLKLAKVSEPNNRFRNPQVNRSEVLECQLCRSNHTAKECHLNPINVVCQLCDRTGHTATNCRPADNYRGYQQHNRGYNNQGARFNSGFFNGGYNSRVGNSGQGGYNRLGFNNNAPRYSNQGGFNRQGNINQQGYGHQQNSNNNNNYNNRK